jgi:hypothetical protein
MSSLSLAGHPWADKYFARSTPWEWHDGARIDLNDGTTLDQLATVVFHGGEGLKTVSGYFAWLLTQYPDPEAIPADLDATVARVLTDLEARGAIAVTDDKRPVEPRFDLPLSEQEPETE